MEISFEKKTVTVWIPKRLEQSSGLLHDVKLDNVAQETVYIFS